MSLTNFTNERTNKEIDCVVCGSCVIDVLVRPVDLSQPIGAGQLVRTKPIEITTGGIVSNAGITLARLGMKAAAFTCVGDDDWAELIRGRYRQEGLNADRLLVRTDAPTSTSVVLVDPSGERSFLHAVGAPKKLDERAFLDNLDLFASSRAMVLGYFPLLPNLLVDLPEVLAAVRNVGCLTAIDAAGDGGALAELAPLLPLLDVYVPSLQEAAHQTGESEPRRILEIFRDAGAAGLIGVKLGAQGALLSPEAGEWIVIPSVAPPGEVIDATGAGDCFLGGLLTGILKGLPLEASGRLAAAVGAQCVTGVGATAAVTNYEEACRLASL